MAAAAAAGTNICLRFVPDSNNNNNGHVANLTYGPELESGGGARRTSERTTLMAAVADGVVAAPAGGRSVGQRLFRAQQPATAAVARRARDHFHLYARVHVHVYLYLWSRAARNCARALTVSVARVLRPLRIRLDRIGSAPLRLGRRRHRRRRRSFRWSREWRANASQRRPNWVGS